MRALNDESGPRVAAMILPAPLVPAFVDLSRMPIPMLPPEFLNGQSATTGGARQRLAVVRLAALSWSQVPAGSLPGSNAELARMSGSPHDFGRIRSHALADWTLCRDGRYYHPAVAKVALATWLKAEITTLARLRSGVSRLAEPYPQKSTPDPQFSLFDPQICLSYAEQICGCESSICVAALALARLDGTARILRSALVRKLLSGDESSHEPSRARTVPITLNPSAVPSSAVPASPLPVEHGPPSGSHLLNGSGLVVPAGTTASAAEQKTKRPETEPPKTVAKNGEPYSPPPCPQAEVLDLWAANLPELLQPDRRYWNRDRRRALTARWRETACAERWPSAEHGLERMRQLFAFVRLSPLLMGRQSRRDGKPSRPAELPWLLRPENWSRLHDGGFHHFED